MSRQIAKINDIKYIIRFLFYFILIITIKSCKTFNIIPEKEDTPKHDFDINLSGDTPNYSEMKFWVEHPEKADHYASLPKNYTDSLYNSNSRIDVFFIHPTLYTKGNRWNADINDKKLNRKIGNSGFIKTGIVRAAPVIWNDYVIVATVDSQKVKYFDLKSGKKAFELNIHPDDRQFKGGSPWGGMSIDKKNNLLFLTTGLSLIHI